MRKNNTGVFVNFHVALRDLFRLRAAIRLASWRCKWATLEVVDEGPTRLYYLVRVKVTFAKRTAIPMCDLLAGLYTLTGAGGISLIDCNLVQQ